MVKIYTRKGDDGTTGLLYGGRVAKSSAAIEVNGAVDEAQATLGLARAEAEPGSELDDLLLDLERDLWVLMAELATAPENRHKLTAGASLVTPEMVGALEVRIDALDRALRDADRVRRAGAEPRLGCAGRGPHGGAAGRAGLHRSNLHARLTGRPLPQPAVGPPVDHGALAGGRARGGTLARPRSGGHAGPGGPIGFTGPIELAERTVSAAVPFTRSALLGVGWADAGDPGALADAAGVAVTVVGVPVLETAQGPSVAPGVPDAVVVGVGAPAVMTAIDGNRARQRGFTGKAGQSMTVVDVPSGQGSLGADAPAVVFVGCGNGEVGAGGDAVAAVLRRAAATLVRAGGKSGAAVLVVPTSLADAAGSPRRAAQAVTEGAVLAAYRFVSHKSESEGGGIERFVVAGAGLDAAEIAEGTRRGLAVADAVCLARDLVNEPPSSLTPDALRRRRRGARRRAVPA